MRRFLSLMMLVAALGLSAGVRFMNLFFPGSHSFSLLCSYGQIAMVLAESNGRDTYELGLWIPIQMSGCIA